MPTSKRNLANSASQATNSENMMHVPGSIIGNRYQIIQKLGRLETGKTYLAKDLQATVDGRCVVEQLSLNCNNEANWRIIKQYLLNEIAVLERLGDHPQIPQYYDHFTENREFYLVREYIDGDNLQQEVERKVFNEADTICLIQDALRILDFIHKTNVIHRDVQPVNLIRRKQDNMFVLIDFGAIREIESTEINLQGQLIFDPPDGNCSYIAPEQKAGESNFGSDIYALGKTAIYALTGKSPQELEQTDLDWQTQCQISPKLEDILSKMISSEIEHRYGSALEVLNNLRPLLRIRQVVGGRYLITRYLGGKRNIETYLADNLRRQYQSPCVVKQLELPSVNSDAKVRLEQSFAEELSVLERLGYHEQIPQLWDHFEENDEFYLVQEYFQGDNLAQKTAQQDLSKTQIIQILVSALAVLKFIHQNRIIHRNIKPSNLIIDEENNQVILTDFGILADIKSLPNGTSEHSSDQDKQNYWSPEQIAGRPTISSDLYGLGMTTIEALTKVKPATFARNQQTGKLLWSQNIDLDRRLIKIIDKMVQPDLGQRYQSADKVLQDLQKIKNFSYPEPKQSVKLGQKNPKTSARLKLPALPFFIGFLGIGCLFGSIEYAFPLVRPAYYWYQGQKMLLEQPKTALDTFTKAIDLKPQSALAWSGRGDALSILERYPQASEAYSEAIELNPNNVANWKKQGTILSRLERFTDAIAVYDRALELDPEDGEIYNLRGQALYQLQQYEAALTMQEAALEIDRLNAQYWSDRALNLLQLGRYDDALTTFIRVQAIEPNNLQLWQAKFLVLKAFKRPQEAERVFREVNNNYLQLLQAQPENQHIWIAQGDFFTSAQMYQQAVDAYDQALKLTPNIYEAWLAKGKALTQLGQNQQALASLDKAWQIRPQSYMVLQAQGSVYQNQNNLTQAIAKYDQGIEINPDYAPLWRDRGLALNQQRKYLQAIESLIKARNLAAYDAQTWQGLAIAWDATDQNQKALSAVNRAIGINPRNPSHWSVKGLIYAKKGQYNEACDTYRQSRVAASDSPEIINSMMQLGCRMN
ncbi:MAG: tetratricopeptide repeat protein [Waterburya sp.]